MRAARRAVPTPRLVDNRNRVALTKEALDALGLGPGDYVEFVDSDEAVRVVKLHIEREPMRRVGRAG